MKSRNISVSLLESIPALELTSTASLQATKICSASNQTHFSRKFYAITWIPSLPSKNDSDGGKRGVIPSTTQRRRSLR
jgi:hypothetical protein